MPTPTPTGGRLPRSLTVAFGVVVVAAFGSWFYGFGVLVEPVVADTGWPEALLSTAYGVGLLVAGAGAVVSGRLIDRSGPRPVLAGGAVAAAVGTVVTATAGSSAVFVTGAVLTQGVVGAVGYYAAVHATIALLAPADRVRAITVNTLWGAFASPVFLPLMAWLTLGAGWRGAVAVSGALVVGAFGAAAALVPTVSRPVGRDAGRGPLRDLRAVLGDHVLRRLLVVAVLAGLATSVLFLYQVPEMVAAGLALTTASAVAGLRGLFQLLGRLPLPWLVHRVGPAWVLRGSLACTGLSALLLPATGTPVVAVAFAVVAGAAVGVLYTTESLYTVEVVDAAAVGTVLGVYAMVRGIGSAVGPTGAGLLTAASGTRSPALVAVAVVAVTGAFLVPARMGAAADRP